MNRIPLVALLLTLLCNPFPLQASPAQWQQGVFPPEPLPNPKALTRKWREMMQFFLDRTLYGKGKEEFEQASRRSKKNISWQDPDGGMNVYLQAFERSYPTLSKVDLQGMPLIILLIPHLESLWDGSKGNTAADYGYWQLKAEVVEELKTLEQVPEQIRSSHADTIRSDPLLSTQAAQAHLRRYWYYFRKVALFPEPDAWLFTLTAYNWGAGNVKRMLAEMQSKGIKTDFSNFYAYLRATQRNFPDDRSMRAATDYVPNLWNIALLLDSEQGKRRKSGQRLVQGLH